jgi:hypothetical protein
MILHVDGGAAGLQTMIQNKASHRAKNFENKFCYNWEFDNLVYKKLKGKAALVLN